MRKLHSLVTDAIAECLARTNGVLASEILEHLWSTQGEALALHAQTTMRKGLLSIIREALKNTSLDDGVETGEPTQLPLPGFKAPTTLPVLQSNGDYRYILFEKLTGADFLQAIKTREIGILHDQQRVDDLKQKYRLLRPYLARNKTMTVGEAIRLFSHEQHSTASDEE